MSKEVRILRVDGTVEMVEVDTMEQVRKLIDAEALDTVILSWMDGVPDQVMMVDDLGHVQQRKPVNAQATRHYHSVCKVGTTHQIVGDAVILNNREWKE